MCVTFEFWRRQTNAAQKFSISSEGLSAPVSGMKVVVKLNVLFFLDLVVVRVQVWGSVCVCVWVCVCGIGFFFLCGEEDE